MMNPARHIPVLALLALCVFGFVPEAGAGCAQGLPCITNATPNNPADPNDGPNATNAPNRAAPRDLLGAGACNGATPAQGCACDADLMNQIYSRAFLESQRDTIKAEVLIRKPDSVLEYTCFNNLATVAVSRAGPIFSESTRWRPATVTITSALGVGEIGNMNFVPIVLMNTWMGPMKLENSIRGLVRDSLTPYINENFSHRFLGGAATALDYTPGSGGSYNCTYMDRVYNLSKCTDIITDDRFWRFADLINPDPRRLPAACTGGTQITQQRIDLAENVNKQYAAMDAVRTYGALLRPPGGAITCAPPIPTGLIVEQKQHNVDGSGNVTLSGPPTTFPDMVCPNPNCWYSGTGGGCQP